jgi:hypothetical protein
MKIYSDIHEKWQYLRRRSSFSLKKRELRLFHGLFRQFGMDQETSGSVNDTV